MTGWMNASTTGGELVIGTGGSGGMLQYIKLYAEIDEALHSWFLKSDSVRKAWETKD